MTVYTKTHRWPHVASAFSCLVIAGFAAVSPASAATGGEETFQSTCASCHGADASGNTPLGKQFKVRDLRSAAVQKQSDSELQGIITNGKSPMPAFGASLDKAKVQELVAYLRSVATK